MKKLDIYKIYGKDYKEMTKRILTESNLEAVILNKCEKNACIGIKPNLVTPTPADFGATTHPEVVAGIIEYLQEHGFTNIIMAEGSWIGDKTSDAYEYCGYRQLSEKYGVEFVDSQKDTSTTKDCDGLDIKICNVVSRIDFMINVPVLKGHCQTKITCALKNMKGLIPNSEKRHFHTQGLHKPIAHLSKGIHQDFIVVDHICGDLDFEEGGNPIVRNCIMTGMDPVLIDSYGCSIIGISPEDVPYIMMAEEIGSGSTDISKANIVVVEGDKDKDSDNNPNGKPMSKDEVGGEEKHRSVLDVKYAVDEVDSCSACYASLVPALLRLKEEGLLDKLNETVAIGQGHRGQKGKVGVGQCTKDYEYNIPGCPPKEEDIYEGLKQYILR